MTDQTLALTVGLDVIVRELRDGVRCTSSACVRNAHAGEHAIDLLGHLAAMQPDDGAVFSRAEPHPDPRAKINLSPVRLRGEP